MKQLKTIILGLFFVSLCSSPLFAQNSFQRFGSIEDRVTKLTEELNLTPEQAEQVKAIHEKHASKRQEIRSYVLENVIPVLKSQRLKLDSEISNSDKATIEELRNRLQASKPQLQQARKDFREALMQGKKPTEELTQMNALREAHRADIEEVRSLADKYRSQIEGLKAEIEGDRQQWREDIRAIAKEHFEGSDVPIGRFHRHRFRHRPHPRFFSRHLMSPVGFLLLDPNKDYSVGGLDIEGTERGLEERRFNVFPNPTVQTNTIEFEVQKAGNVRIDLLSRNGAFIRTILDGYKLEGTHQVKVDISNLSDKMYFYRISDASGEVTKEFLIKD